MDERKCNTCHQTMPVSEFYPRKLAGGIGYTGDCKECKSAKARVHYLENMAQHKRTVKRRYDTHGRFARYGLTKEQYDAMLQRQGNCCALCQAPKPGGKGKWHIDHLGGTDQSKGFYQCRFDAVRGLLCHKCNVTLGSYEKLTARVGFEKISQYLNWTAP